MSSATVYGPAAARRHLAFPAFSYVTTVLVAGDARSLGDPLHGAACALYGTLLGALPAVLALLLIRPAALSALGAALAVALGAFVIALPAEPASPASTLVAKRVALGQIVIIYVATFTEEDITHGHAMLRPVHVAASTALGAAASILALVLPYPKLATSEVREKSRLYTEIATERVRLLVEAFCAENISRMASLISQARCFGASSTKLLHNIKLHQGNLNWERPPLKFLPSKYIVRNPLDRLQDIEMPLKGMEIAIISTTSVPTKSFDQILKPNLLTLRDQISLRLLMQSHFTSKKELGDRALQLPLSAFPESSKDLPSFFFLFCMNLLHNEPSNKPLLDSAREKKVTPTTEQSEESCTEEPQQRTQMKPKATFSLNLTSERLTAVLKCSLSLALAVLFGVLFSRDNGYWSGLTVAITMTPHRESTFKLANLRAQGTALGSVYGVLGAIISQNLMELRFLTLLPWIIFTSFLRNSRMYAQAGGMAAIISALIILGRRDYGSPTAFAITRLTETFIGFSCSIFVEVLVQPTRASTLARNQLHQSLKTVRECKDCVLNPGALKEKERRLKGQVNKLKKYINEAEAEPNLWFSPSPLLAITNSMAH
uniref:Uncharacterized protein n=1 Tax=Ananas comosus var. bracteatus TaxID=296719 RepID=A0A6V7NGD1_ANACO|nr:unnamed protein product [Ananas comosus var. bracteatus]